MRRRQNYLTFNRRPTGPARIEPSAIGQVKIQGMLALASPQIGKTLIANVREIPPQKRQSPTHRKIAPQTRIKSFTASAGAIENRYAASMAIQDHPFSVRQWLSGEQLTILRGVKQRQQRMDKYTGQRL